MGAHGLCRDGGERHDHREIRVDGLNFGMPNNGREREGGFEHGEVVADARAWPGAEG
jgi:hypothetical protein